ncbi:MAG: hypothetical protein ING94_20090 [Rhodocyclaceae bacterium]|nr:hypothetical protein [Rhodocyclaceae bacterium]
MLEFVEGSEFALVKRIDPVPFLNQSIYAFDYALLHRHGRHGNRDSGKRSLIQALNVGTVRVSGILCARHIMTMRSMYAKQENDDCGPGPSGADAVHSEGTH